MRIMRSVESMRGQTVQWERSVSTVGEVSQYSGRGQSVQYSGKVSQCSAVGEIRLYSVRHKVTIYRAGKPSRLF